MATHTSQQVHAPHSQAGGGDVRHVLIVRGGWEGHDPITSTDEICAGLGTEFRCTFADSFDIYSSCDDLLKYDLIVQCWSMGELTPPQEAALVGAIEAGVGFAGWHGGIIGTCVSNAAYLRMVGGRFLWHPDGSVPYRITIDDNHRQHPIVDGVEDFDVCTEQYWVQTDPLNTILAQCTFTPKSNDPWSEPVSMPVVWTRHWGQGRVFVCTLGHSVSDLRQMTTQKLVQRGLRWAARRSSHSGAR